MKKLLPFERFFKVSKVGNYLSFYLKIVIFLKNEEKKMYIFAIIIFRIILKF